MERGASPAGWRRMLGGVGLLILIVAAGCGAISVVSTSAARMGPIRDDSGPLAYGASMFFQILLPLATGIYLQHRGVTRPQLLRLAGFLTWKIGCDFGFFLVQGENLARALHPVGLACYTAVQFAVFQWVGLDLLRDRVLPSLGLPSDRPLGPTWEAIRAFASKYGCEYEGGRGIESPFSHVLLMPLIVILAAVASWPAYDVGVQWYATRAVDLLGTYRNFPYRQLVVFTIGGYFGHLMAYNVAGNAYRIVVEFRLRRRATGPTLPPPGRWMRWWSSRPLARQLRAHRVNGQFLCERLAGIVVVAFLLPFLARHFARSDAGSLSTPDQPPAERVMLSPVKWDDEVAVPAVGKAPEPETGEQRKSSVPHRILFEVERPVTGPHTGEVHLSLRGAERIYYTSDGSWPMLNDDGEPVAGTARYTQPLEFADAAVVRAAALVDGRLGESRSIRVVPNRWSVQLAQLPPRMREITDVFVTGAFRDWSHDLVAEYRLQPAGPPGGWQKLLQIDGAVRGNYKFVLRFADGTIEWYSDPQAPIEGQPPLDNNVVSPWTRLRRFFRNQRDGQLDEAALEWAIHQKSENELRATLLLLPEDVDDVYLKLPRLPAKKLTKSPVVRDGVSLAAYHGTVELPVDEIDTDFCFLARDGEHWWAIGPQGAVAVDSDDERARAAQQAERNLFVVRRPALAGRDDPRSRVIYFAMLDRFVDGDPSNNGGANWATFDCPESDVPRNLRLHQGGDLRGLFGELDYLRELGIGMVWLTPLVRNFDGVDHLQPTPLSSYHGYWGTDFFDIDPHWGDWADFERVVTGLHERNMQLMLDFAPNHSSPQYLSDGGRLLRAGREVSAGFLRDAELPAREQWFHHVGGMDAPGDSNRAPDRAVRDCYGLADLRHGASFVDQYLTDAAQFWLDKGVDALRVDSVKHCDEDFLRRFARELADEHWRRRRKELFIAGEWFDGGVFNQASLNFVNQTPHFELLDFSLANELYGITCGDRSFEGFSEYLVRRHEAFHGRESWQVTFLDNHDMPRLALRLHHKTIGKGLPLADTHRRMELGMSLLMTLPGIPAIYYGTERYLGDATPEWKGDSETIGGDPFNRSLMPPDRTPNPMTSIIRKLADLRRQSRAIQQAPCTIKWADRDGLVFERAVKGGQRALAEANSDKSDHRTTTGPSDDEAPRLEELVVVAANRGPARTIQVTDLTLPDGLYSDVLRDTNVRVQHGKAKFDLPEDGVLVLQWPRAKEPVPAAKRD